jgi:hypothetical protein
VAEILNRLLRGHQVAVACHDPENRVLTYEVADLAHEMP